MNAVPNKTIQVVGKY